MHFCYSATAMIGYISFFILWKSRSLPIRHPIWSLTCTSSTRTSILLTKWLAALFVNTSTFLTPMCDFSYPPPSHLAFEKRFYVYNFGIYQGSISRTDRWVSTSHYQLIFISCTLFFRFLQIVVGGFGNDLIQLHSSISFSVTGRHQSNGKAERFGRTLQDYRFYVGSNTSWYEVLTFSNVTINSTPVLLLAGNTSFQIDLGFTPLSPPITYSLS